MDVGLAIFLDRRRHPSGRAGPRRRGARLRVADGHRAHAHPGLGRDGRPRRRRRWTTSTAARTTRSSRSRSPPRRPRSSIVGHQRLPRDRARPDRAGQADRLARRALRRALRLRRRRGLEQAGDAQPRHRPATRHGNMRERVEAMKAIWSDRRGRIPRQARGLRPDLAVAEAAPVAVPGLHRRQRPARRGPRPALRRRLDAEHEGARRRSAPRIAALRERAGRHVPVTYYGATPENLDDAARPRASTAR